MKTASIQTVENLQTAGNNTVGSIKDKRNTDWADHDFRNMTQQNNSIDKLDLKQEKPYE